MWKTLIYGCLFFVLFTVPVCAADQVAKFGWDRSPEAIVTGYQLYRSTTASGPYEAVGEQVPQVAEGVSEVLAQDTVPYVPGTSYYYVVRAVAEKAASGDSNEVAVVSLTVPVLRVKVQVIVDVE